MVSEFSEFFCYDGSVSEGSAYKDWSEYDVLKHFSINLVTLKGFEPLLADPESAVLPLNYRVTIGEIIASEI